MAWPRARIGTTRNGRVLKNRMKSASPTLITKPAHLEKFDTDQPTEYTDKLTKTQIRITSNFFGKAQSFADESMLFRGAHVVNRIRFWFLGPRF